MSDSTPRAWLRSSARVACAVLCAGAILAARPAQAQSAPAPESNDGAYLNGKLIRFTPAEIKRGRVLVVGREVIGPLVRDHKPHDRRPNLYVVSPGTQYQSNDEQGALTFNLVVNTLPRKAEPVEWDVYWALVLDPAVSGNITDERDLLLATQDAFVPGDLFEFNDLPAVAILREYLRLESLADLDTLRRPDGMLPRVAIVPSKFVVRASAVDPDNPPPEGPLARAWSRIRPRKAPPQSPRTAVKP
ncbi:MAG: hypothetical protein ACE14L_16585 [Terriglobales bacterium]